MEFEGFSEREIARIHAVLSGPEPGRLTWWRLWIAGEERAFTDLSWDAPADNFGMAMRAVVRGPEGFADRSALGREAILEILVDGIPAERFTGTLSSAVAQRAATGRLTGGWEVVAASRGDALEEKELKTRLSFDAAAPSDPVRQALGLAGYTGRISVEPVEKPPFTRKDATGFSATDSPADVLDGVGAEVPSYEFWDVPGDGHEAFLRKAPEDLGEPAFVFDAALLEGFRPIREEPRVAWVGVRRQKENPPVNEEPWEILARAPVPGSKADEDTVEWIETSDRSSEADVNAWQTARDRAQEISRRSTVSFVGPEHPLLRRGSAVWVREETEDAEGPVVLTWAVYLETLGGQLPRKRTTYSGACAVVGSERPPKVEPLPAPATPGVGRPAWGADHLGDYYGDDARFFEDENGDIWATSSATSSAGAPVSENAEGEYEFV